MRKLSYLFLALAVAMPVATNWYMSRVARAYSQEHGFPAEGIGFVGLIVYGIRGMLLLAVLALLCAAIAYRNANGQKPVMRRIELALFCVPIAAPILLAVQMVPTLPAAVYVLTGLKLF